MTAATFKRERPPFACIPEWVLYADDLSDRAVRLYGVLDRRASRTEDRVVQIGRAEMARLLDVSTDTVDRALAELEEFGALEVQRGGLRVMNSYLVRFTEPSRTAAASRTDAASGDAATPSRTDAATASRTAAAPLESRDEETHAEQQKPRGNPLVQWYVDEARRLKARPPQRVVGQVAGEIGRLQAEGFSDAELKAAIGLMLQRGTHPSTLPSLVFQAQVTGATRPVASPLPPLQRAKQFVLNSGWQLDVDDLAEMLGRDFGLEGPEKQELLAMAKNVRASRAEKQAA